MSIAEATEEYELINYSDHGSVVDGVLYSCDFSDKGRDNGNKLEPPVFTLDDLTARGVGLRAESVLRYTNSVHT